MSNGAPEHPVYYTRPALPVSAREEFQQIYGVERDKSLFLRAKRLADLGLHIAHDKKLSHEQVVTLMREASWEMLSEAGDTRRNRYEVSMYAGCQHGEVIQDLEWVLIHPPDFLYLSDLAGSYFETDSKKIFYNDVINHVRKTIGQDALRSLDSSEIRTLVSAKGEEILAMTIDQEKKQTVLDGYRKLYSFVHEFAPDDTSMPNPDDRGRVILWISRFTPQEQNHGYWMGSLTKDTREKILGEIASKTQDVVGKLKQIAGKGTRVILVPGNWDGQESVGLIAFGKKSPDDPGSPEDHIVDYFNTILYVKSQGLEVYDTLSIVDTETSLTIMAPFFWLLRDFDQERYNPTYQIIKGFAEEARREGKLIILYPHAAIHQAASSGANYTVARNALQLMKDMEVDEIPHGHDHATPTDHASNEYPVYAYDGETAKHLTDVGQLNKLGLVPLGIVDYVPKGNIAVSVRRRNVHLRMSQNVFPAKIL